MERRLAAIMATDMVGYSRLIWADEEGTIEALKALRADLIDPKLAEHNGRIVKRSRELALECALKAASFDKFDSEVQWRQTCQMPRW